MSLSTEQITPTQQRLLNLKLHGLLSHWSSLTDEQTRWLDTWLSWEEQEKSRRSLERRLQAARIGRFKPLADFDWQWPKRLDQATISELMQLHFLKDATNAIFIGSNGVGKTTVAQNIAHEAAMQGHTVLFSNAGQMLNELAAQDGDNALRRRLKHYSQPNLLVIDEVGYLSYSDRHADLLFEIINRRYENKSTLITTNRPFSEWGQVFPNAACVVSLVDRLIHHSEIVNFEGESFRMREAKERSQQRQKLRHQNPKEDPQG